MLTDGRLMIEVEDDGIGMEAEREEEVGSGGGGPAGHRLFRSAAHRPCLVPAREAVPGGLAGSPPGVHGRGVGPSRLRSGFFIYNSAFCLPLALARGGGCLPFSLGFLHFAFPSSVTTLRRVDFLLPFRRFASREARDPGYLSTSLAKAPYKRAASVLLRYCSGVTTVS